MPSSVTPRLLACEGAGLTCYDAAVTALPPEARHPARAALLAALLSAAGCEHAAPASPPVVSVPIVPVANSEGPPPAPACPAGMILIPEGSFTMGSPEDAGDGDEHPAHPVDLSAYCLDRTEVTVARYRECVAGGGCKPALTTEKFQFFDQRHLDYFDRFCTAALVDHDQHPINCVDWSQADAYCRFTGGRLPTEAEWEYAARGSDGRRYPWGSEPPTGKLINGCGSECVEAQQRIGLEDVAPMFEGTDGFEGTAPVGSFPAGASPFGVEDMVGNVWEWTADWSAPYPEAKAVNPTGPEAPEKKEKVIRGIASWSGEHPQYGSTARGAHVPDVRLSVGGFRCAHTPR
jgi:formylglycine-generating enzyme required for sulfatase activity